MTRKVYRTAQGKIVDLGALVLQNENVRAVGNMNVNARGDLIDSNNRPIDSRNQQVSRQYNRQTTNVHDDVVYSSAKQATAKTKKESAPFQTPAQPMASLPLEVEIPPSPEDFEDDFIREPAPVSEPTLEPVSTSPSLPTNGLAAAIAKARQIKQEPLKTPRQIAQETQGVKKL